MRAAASIRAKVIGRVPANTVFWFYPEDYDQQREWVAVEKSDDPYSLLPGTRGYVHRSRIKPLHHLARPGKSELYFRYDLQPFDNRAHKTRQQDGLYQILDVPETLGTDGNRPKVEVAGIRVRVQGQSVTIPRRLYRGLFECTNDFAVRRKHHLYFIYQLNSDGAGAYTVVWVLSEAGLKQRLAGSFY